MTTEDMVWSSIGYGVLVLTLWWAYKDQSIGIDGGFEFPRATRPIRFWVVTSICIILAVGMPILFILYWFGF
jgi:hypothetical protein